jgi:hypothetical protein
LDPFQSSLACESFSLNGVVEPNPIKGFKMDTEFFWNLIEKTFEDSKGNLPKQVELLTESLAHSKLKGGL